MESRCCLQDRGWCVLCMCICVWVCVSNGDPCEAMCMQEARTQARGNNFCEQLCPELAWFLTKGVLLSSAPTKQTTKPMRETCVSVYL